jgi:hypothetical protein
MDSILEGQTAPREMGIQDFHSAFICAIWFESLLSLLELSDSVPIVCLVWLEREYLYFSTTLKFLIP